MFFENIKPYIRIQMMIAACLNVGHTIDGYSIAWSAPILPKLNNITESPLNHVLTKDETSWVVSSMYIGVFGSNVAGYMANLIGRKPCLQIGGTVIFFSYVILALSSNIWMLYFGRLLSGFGVSYATIVSLIYIGEISSSRIRGIILTSTGIFHALGKLIAYSVGPYTTFSGISYVAMSLAALYVIACISLPETPVYYVIKDNEEAAKRALQYLGRTNDITNELRIMMANLQTIDSKGLLWRQLLRTKSNRKALLITIALYFFQMNSGIVISIFYATTIFQKAGSSVQPHVATIIVGVTLLIGAILSPTLVERYGRRILLVLSTIGCCFYTTVIGTYFYFNNFHPGSMVSLGWVPLVAMAIGFVSYAAGLSVIPNTLVSELFATNVRSLGSSTSYMIGLLSGFISTTASGYLMAYGGIHFTFWLFAIVNALALIFVVLFVPETAGKTLMEINNMMSSYMAFSILFILILHDQSRLHSWLHSSL